MTFKDWKEYYTENQGQFDWLNFVVIDTITQSEKIIIQKSLQEFQKGENSEGKNLIHYAREFGNQDYLDAIILFIKEEQQHALVLGKFMKVNDIPKIKTHWVDSVFRGLRKMAGLENSVTVLLTAEVISAIYYKGLYKATNSNILKLICNRILIDEEMHINFQTFTLSEYYEKKSSFGKLINRIFHRILMAGTTIVVWAGHKKALKNGGYSFLKFYKEVFEEYNRAVNMIKGNLEIELKLTI
ncbi:hypothetical protein N9544_06360 [Flavobacteriales bacterium]|nr:hypothetical protein [Flavobacteriales bacterium]